MKKIIINNLEETKELAIRIGKLVTPHTLITLRGDLGAGKTTFTKYLGACLGVNKTINSPTFTIMKIYEGIMPIYHLDAYRLEGIKQELGFEEAFDDEGCCIVEWPMYIEEQLPKERLDIQIYALDDTRREFIISAIGSKYEKMLEEL
ncbi:MAG: tRNA (adenosine(37)-N6)-threonylcarbamoyltransferase complex ATPase subunit type 1 TsaE [Erysipelotrichaceae bacterium]